MRSGVADAPYAIHFGHSRQQGGEIPTRRRGIAIRVYILTEQLNLGEPALRQAASFHHYALAGAAALRPTCKRHHTVRARFVAALDDRDIRAVRIVAPRERRVEGLISIEAQPGDAAAPI